MPQTTLEDLSQKIETAKPHSGRDMVYEHILTQMKHGDLPPGSVLNLKSISQELGVSSTPLRDSLIRLEAEGKALVYTGDSNTCENLAAFAKNADVLLCDAAFLDSEWKETLPHLSALKAAQMAKEAGVQRLLLTHLPTTHDKKTMEDEARACFPGAKAVSPGDVIIL